MEVNDCSIHAEKRLQDAQSAGPRVIVSGHADADDAEGPRDGSSLGVELRQWDFAVVGTLRYTMPSGEWDAKVNHAKRWDGRVPITADINL